MIGRNAVTTDRRTDLRPGETSLNLKPDPYYGMVDVGTLPAPKPGPPDGVGPPGGGGPPGLGPPIDQDLEDWLAQVQDAFDAGFRALDRETQNRIEVLTGVRLQQLPPPPRSNTPTPGPQPVKADAAKA